MSTTLWTGDKTQYTATDGEEEEGITLCGKGANREEGLETRNKIREKDKQGEKTERRRSRAKTDGGCKHKRHGKRKVKKLSTQ